MQLLQEGSTRDGRGRNHSGSEEMGIPFGKGEAVNIMGLEASPYVESEKRYTYLQLTVHLCIICKQ